MVKRIIDRYKSKILGLKDRLDMEQSGEDGTAKLLDRACERLFEEMWDHYTKLNRQKALELALLIYSINKNPICLDVIQECLEAKAVQQSTRQVTQSSSMASDGSVLSKMMKIAVASSIFEIVDCLPWGDLETIEIRYKEISRVIHPDRNGQSKESIAAMQRLTSEFQALKKDPVGYSTRHETLMFRAGTLKPYEIDLEETQRRKDYGKSLGWVVDNGFDAGKRSYTWAALHENSLRKDHVTINPAADVERGEVPTQLMPKADGANAAGWELANIEWNAGNSHRFSEKGVYEDFSHSGVSTSKHGTSFVSKNNY